MQSWVPNTGLQIQPQGLIRRHLLCMRLWDRDAAAINDAHVFMFVLEAMPTPPLQIGEEIPTNWRN
jgi:hypothetical protein